MRQEEHATKMTKWKPTLTTNKTKKDNKQAGIPNNSQQNILLTWKCRNHTRPEKRKQAEGSISRQKHEKKK